MQKFTRPTNLEFGIYLPENVRQRIKARLEKLHDLAPSHSKIMLSMKMPFRQVKGELTIRSYGETFHVEAKNSDPEVLYETLEQEMIKQLDEWKARRFMADPHDYEFKYA